MCDNHDDLKNGQVQFPWVFKEPSVKTINIMFSLSVLVTLILIVFLFCVSDLGLFFNIVLFLPIGFLFWISIYGFIDLVIGEIADMKKRKQGIKILGDEQF